MVFDPNNPNAPSDVKATQAAADALGRRLIIVETATEDELAPAVGRLAEAGAGALFVGPHANFRIWPNRLIALVAQHRLPTSYSNGDFVRGRRIDELRPRPGRDVSSGRLICGSRAEGREAGGAPVVLPTRFDFVLNLVRVDHLGRHGVNQPVIINLEYS